MNAQSKKAIEFGRCRTAAHNYLKALAEFEKYKKTSYAFEQPIESCIRDLAKQLSNWPVNATALLDVNNWNFQNLLPNDGRGPIKKPRIDLTAVVTSKDNLSIRWNATGQKEQLQVRIREKKFRVDRDDEEQSDLKKKSKISDPTIDFWEHFANTLNQAYFDRPESELLFIHEIKVVNYLIRHGNHLLAIHIANCVMSIFEDVKSFLKSNFRVTQVNEFEFQYDERGELCGWGVYDVEARKHAENEKWLSNFSSTFRLNPNAFVDAYYADDRRKKFSGIGSITERSEATKVLKELKSRSKELADVIASKDNEIAAGLKIKSENDIKRAEHKEKERTRNDWGTVSKEELTRLVWSKPTTQLAVEFGVSDVSIGKKCRYLGVPKPPLGFWAKVKAGKIPHPRGVVKR